MAAKPCDLSINPEQTCTPMAWGTFVWFPLDLSSRSGEEDFCNRFYDKYNMADKHVTEDVICVNLLFLMDGQSYM